MFDLGDVTTTGDTVTPPPPTPGYGPRPAPAFPTTNVYVAPASIPHQNGLVSGTGADSYPALQAWLDDLPDDCIAIFDSSLGGGTTYSLSHYLRINGQRGITFWGFHTRINMTQAGAYQYHGFDVSGGAERCTFRGFHIVGRNAAGGTFGAFGGSSEHNHGITLGAWCRDITIADCKIERFYGDAVYSNEYGPSDSSIGFYNPWCPQGYYMGGFEVMYNEFGYNGRTGIIWNQGQPTNASGGTRDFGWRIHHNDIHDSGLAMSGAEDATSDSNTQPIREVYITDNRFDSWFWNYWPNNPQGDRGYAALTLYASDWASDSVPEYRGIHIEDNLFTGGTMGAWHHDRDGGSNLSVNVLIGMFNYGSAGSTVPKYDVTIARNVADLPAQQQGAFGYGVLVYNAHGLAIIDNQLQGRPISHSASSDVTVSGNS